MLNQFAVKLVEKTAEKCESGTLETLDKRLIVCFEKLTKTPQTRYADEEEEEKKNSFGGPTRELFMVRSLQKGKKSKKSKVNTVTTKPVSALNLDLNQSSGAVGPLTRSGGRMGDPSKINPIAKGDAAKSGLTLNADPVMRSWSRPCNL